MSSTDDRIVRMQFDNAQFKKGAADTQKSLADLNKAVDSSGKSKGLLNLNDQMGQIGVTASKMSIITTTALATIANKATNVALNLAKSLTFDPIKQGFNEYEELLNKQQTIMNATGLSAKSVKGYLNELNTYSDKTIYSFGNMTDSITKFVNAGIPLPQAVKSIKGIANAAAFAGASTQDANRAMFAFSQSMSTGFVMLNDWQQIENANMGTVQFKQTLLDAGVAAGTLTKRGKEYITTSGKAITTGKGWREGLQEQWASTEVLNAALSTYSDRTTKVGKKAFKAAQDVRTFSAFMDTLKESIGSGWSQIFTSLFGNLKQSTRMWTAVSEAVGGVIKSFFTFTATTLKTWRSMGGFEKTVQGFKNLLSPITALLGAIGDAYREAFPNSGEGAGKGLYAVSAGFEAITRPLQLVADLIRGTTPFLVFFFRVLKIGGKIAGGAVEGVVNFVQSLIGLADVKPPSSGGFIGFIKDLAKAIANAVKKIDSLLQKGATLSQAFGSVDIDLPSMPSMPDMPSMPSMPSVGGDAGAQTSKLAKITAGVVNLKDNILDMGKASEDTAKKGLFDMGDVVNLGKKIGGALLKAKDAIFSFIKGISGEDLMSAFNMAIFATMGYEIIRFIHTVREAVDGIVGIGGSAGKMMEDIGTGIKSFQTQARAKLILNIALAMLVLAGALWILSKIPLMNLLKALGALGATFYALSKVTESMAESVAKMDGKGMSVKLIALGVAMILFAIAITILASAMKKLNGVKWQSVAYAVIAMEALTFAMERLAGIDSKGIVRTALALVIVAFGLMVFAKAVEKFASLDFKTFAEGMVYAAIALGTLTAVLHKFESSVGGALAMTIVVGALWLLVGVIEKFATLKWQTFGEGMAYIAASLLVLGIALYGFTSSLLGAMALVVAVGALWLMVGVIKAFAELDWSAFLKGLAMFSLVLITLGTLMALMGVFSPLILLGAAALLIFGAALFLLGAGIMFLAKGFAALIVLGAAVGAAITAFATSLAIGFAVFMQTLAAEAPVIKQAFLDILQSMLDAMVEAVPMIIRAFKDLWKAVKKEFASPDKNKDAKNSGDKMVASVGDGIEKRIPAITKKAIELTIKFLNAVRSKAGELAQAGVGVIVAVLGGIARKVGDLVQAGANLIIRFIQGIGKQTAKLADAAAKVVIKFINDMANSIEKNTPELVEAFFNLATACVQGLYNGIKAKAGDAVEAVKDMAGDMVSGALNKLKIMSPSRVFMNIGKFVAMGLAKGVQDHASIAIRTTAAMIQGQIALSLDLVSKMVQRLDQTALAARARAMGLVAASKKAQKAANKTKTKKDDRAADKISRSAKSADKAADKAEKKVDAQKAKEARERRWAQADALERAKIKSADAQRQIAASKAAERDAEAARVQAKALEQQSRAAGVTAKQRKEMRKEAARLREVAKEQAKKSNKQLADAQKSAVSAMEWQKRAGEEAAKAFQEQYDAEAKADADAEAFEKLTAAEKAAQRRKEAEELQAKADADLARAKQLAYSDIEAANALADLAMQQAERARELFDQADEFTAQGGSGQVLDLALSDAAALAFNQYADRYDAAYAAAAGGPTVEFTQINNSPEALNPIEVYRQTNNLVTYAADKLAPSAA